MTEKGNGSVDMPTCRALPQDHSRAAVRNVAQVGMYLGKTEILVWLHGDLPPYGNKDNVPGLCTSASNTMNICSPGKSELDAPQSGVCSKMLIGTSLVSESLLSSFGLNICRTTELNGVRGLSCDQSAGCDECLGCGNASDSDHTIVC